MHIKRNTFSQLTSVQTGGILLRMNSKDVRTGRKKYNMGFSWAYRNHWVILESVYYPEQLGITVTAWLVG